MKIKDRVDLVSKIADIVYKKMIVLLVAVGGSGSYAISQGGLLQVAMLSIFIFFIVGVKKELEEIKNG